MTGVSKTAANSLEDDSGFSFGEELIRYNPVAAPTGTEGSGRLDRVSFNIPALLNAGGNLLSGGTRQSTVVQRTQEPQFTTTETEECESLTLLLTLNTYNSQGGYLGTYQRYLEASCSWQDTVLNLPLYQAGSAYEKAAYVSWELYNINPTNTLVLVDELKLETVDVVQENHYYAFGLDMAGVSNTGANSHNYTYKPEFDNTLLRKKKDRLLWIFVVRRLQQHTPSRPCACPKTKLQKFSLI